MVNTKAKLPLRLPNTERHLGPKGFLLSSWNVSEWNFSSVDFSKYSIRNILWFYMNFLGIIVDFFKNVVGSWTKLHRNISDSQEIQTDRSVNSASLGIFTWWTSGGSGRIHVMICGNVVVKNQCHNLHNLWGIFQSRLRKHCETFWGNLRESLPTRPTLMCKSLKDFCKTFSRLHPNYCDCSGNEIPWNTGRLSGSLLEYLRHIIELLKRTTSFSNCGLAPTNGCKSTSGACLRL